VPDQTGAVLPHRVRDAALNDIPKQEKRDDRGEEMNLKAALARQFVRRLSPQDALDLAGEAMREWIVRLPVEERVAFLSRLVEQYLGMALQGLARQERATLMNDLLPVIARHFPLSDVDILGAFADFDSGQMSDEEEL